MESSLTASSVDVPMSNDSKKRNGDSIVDYESEEEEKSQEDDDEEDEIEPTQTVSILKPVTEAPVDTSKTDNLHAMKAEDVKKLMIAESAARDFIMPELPFCEVKVIRDDTIIELRNECVDFNKAEEIVSFPIQNYIKHSIKNFQPDYTGPPTGSSTGKPIGWRVIVDYWPMFPPSDKINFEHLRPEDKLSSQFIFECGIFKKDPVTNTTRDTKSLAEQISTRIESIIDRYHSQSMNAVTSAIKTNIRVNANQLIREQKLEGVKSLKDLSQEDQGKVAIKSLSLFMADLKL